MRTTLTCLTAGAIIAAALGASISLHGYTSSLPSYMPGERVTIAKDTFACRDTAALDGLDDQRDADAYVALLTRYIISARCQVVDAGADVHIVRIDTLGKRTKARIVGIPDDIWFRSTRINDEGPPAILASAAPKTRTTIEANLSINDYKGSFESPPHPVLMGLANQTNK